MKIRNLAEANQALQPYVPLVSQLTGKDTTLNRIRPLMALVGNPQDRIKIVHIAGTSGKTSTAYFIAALLTASGKHVGLTVSPHVDSVTERVQLNGVPISDNIFCEYLGEFLDSVAELSVKPSYFELLYAFSFWVFEREHVDYAVIETGMGGLYDATNVATSPDKVCVITDIGFDHMHILGHTIEEITAQKAGIIHDDNLVVMYEQSTAVNEVVKSHARAKNADLRFIDTEIVSSPSYEAEMPAFQKRNWQLAFATYELLRERDKLAQLTQEQLAATQHIQVPGRMDIRQINGKTVIMDGAHNGQKMETFLESFRQLYPGVKPAVLIALKEGKEPTEIAPLLAPLAARIIITNFHTSQDLPVKSQSVDYLAKIFEAANASNVTVQPDLLTAFDELLAQPEDICIVTGSFYMLSQLRSQEELK